MGCEARKGNKLGFWNAHASHIVWSNAETALAANPCDKYLSVNLPSCSHLLLQPERISEENELSSWGSSHGQLMSYSTRFYAMLHVRSSLPLFVVWVVSILELHFIDCSIPTENFAIDQCHFLRFISSTMLLVLTQCVSRCQLFVTCIVLNALVLN